MNAALANISPTFTPDSVIADALTASWLAEVTLRLRREVCWLWHQRGSTATHIEQLPPAIDLVSESLDLMRFAEDKRRFFANDITAYFLSERIQNVRSEREINRGPWSAIRHRLALDDANQLVLALGLLPSIDPASAAVIAACQNDSQKTQPTLALAQRLLDSTDLFFGIDSVHVLIRSGLLLFQGEFDNTGWHRGYEVSPLIANALVQDDGKIPADLRLIQKHTIVARMTPALDAVVGLLRSPPSAPQFIPLLGDVGTDFADWAAMLCHTTGRLLLELAQPNLPTNTRLAALAAWCWLYDADLLLPKISAPADDHARDRDRIQWPEIPLRWFVATQDMASTKQFPSHALQAAVILPATDFDMRMSLLRQALGQHAVGLDQDMMEAARRFRLGAAAIKSIGQAAASFEILTGENLHALCRAQIRLDLGTLAQPVIPRFKFNELVLPPSQALQLGEIVHAMRSLTRVHYGWGTARAWNDAGLSVLFCGPPGTGKTMAAEAIAEELQLPMFRIDLSQVVNKYIGETEKNLKKVFDAAEESDCVIFFDEADALFGKRTNVKDAHDRFANIEISYLLERMERLKGIAVLATNRRKDLDEAFLRRLRYLVEFPLPGEEERERLWRYVFPTGVDISSLDLPYLARSFQLTGGHIRSIAFNACLQADHHAEPRIEMPLVLAAIKRELDKLNRPNSPESFGRYQAEVTPLFEESLR